MNVALTTIAFSALLVFLYMTLVFFLAKKIKDNSIVDIAWGIGFILIAIFTNIFASEVSLRQTILLILILAWGLRLSAHIYTRNQGKGEDPRYKKFRDNWKKNFLLKSYVNIFLLQGLLMLIISAPIFVINIYGDQPLNSLNFLGIIIWIIGFLFEAVSDYQLLKFKERNKAKVLDKGLWRYSRHPNYFGETLQWWGVFILSLGVENALLGLIGPLTITFLLLRVSGVTLLEKKYKGNKEYIEYQKKTSTFIPWFPKKSS